MRGPAELPAAVVCLRCGVPHLLLLLLDAPSALRIHMLDAHMLPIAQPHPLVLHRCFAAKGASPEVVRLMLELGADAGAGVHATGNTPLHIAALSGLSGLCKLVRCWASWCRAAWRALLLWPLTHRAFELAVPTP